MPSDQTIELSGRTGDSHVFSTVAAQRGEVQTIDLKPTFISLGLPTTAFKPEFRNTTENGVFDAAVGGGRFRPGEVWIFMGSDYIGYNLVTEELSGPANIAANWGQGAWPNGFTNDVNAAVTFTSQPEFMWFFQGDQYFRYHALTNTMAGGPHQVMGNWPGWPDSFGSDIDAGVEGRGKYEGMAWFFKGSEYIRYNDATVKGVDIGPTPIASVWKGWPASFTSVDCAINGTGSESELIHFFKDDQFITYNLKSDQVIGPPKPIASKWPKLAAFMRRPQLFLAETIQFKTYYGPISAGPIKSESHGMDPGSEQTYTVIVKRTESQSITDTMTVLESQDQSLVDDVNTSVHDEANEASSGERYDYKFDSSFEGELDYTGFGGDVSASLNFAGSSNDVRQSASKASMNAIQKQVRRTEQNRRQTTRVVTGTQISTSEFESTFTKTVRNNTNRSVNIGAFQLVQNYLTLVVLSGVKLAFAGQGRPEIVPISRLDTLVQKYIADPSQGDVIKKAIIGELQQVLDYRNTSPISVVKDVGGGRVEFDTGLTSMFPVKNPDGTVQRQLEVQGIILAKGEFNVLTDAVLLTELNIG